MPNSKNHKAKALFLDRDGILNRDVGYVFRESQLELVPGIVELLNIAASLNYLLVVITNQSGIARGMFEVSDMHHFNLLLQNQILRSGGPKLDAVYFCPHLPDGKVSVYAVHCQCRKPSSGMIDAAVSYFGIDTAKSFMLGDKPSDMECASKAGVRGIQVGPGPTSAFAHAHFHQLYEVSALISGL